jgi:hypothetical protein
MTQPVEQYRRAPWGIATSIGDLLIGVGLFTFLLSTVAWLPVALECLWKTRDYHGRLGHLALFSGLRVIGTEALLLGVAFACCVAGLLLVLFDSRRHAGR